MKTTFALFFTLVISAAAFGWGSPKPAPAPVETQAPEIFIPTEDPGRTFTQATITASVKNAARLVRLTEQVDVIINSEKFKTRILNAWYQGKAQFKDTTYSNAEVYRKLREGAEMGSQPDWTWNLEIEISKSWCSTLGWTYPSVKKFWINSCNFDKRTDSGLVGTICHEYVHKLGFTHDYKNTLGREYSVPYAVGTVCAELYKEMF